MGFSFMRVSKVRTQDEILADETISNIEKAKELADNLLEVGVKEGKSRTFNDQFTPICEYMMWAENVSESK